MAAGSSSRCTPSPAPVAAGACIHCRPDGVGAAAQDLISRYNVKDVLPKLRAYSHEWDAEVEVRARCTALGS